VQRDRGLKRYPWREEEGRRDYTLQRTREDDRQPERRPRREEPSWKEGAGRDDREIINTIVGGFTAGGSCNTARKKHPRAVQQVNTIYFRPRMPPITFTDENFKGVDPS